MHLLQKKTALCRVARPAPDIVVRMPPTLEARPSSPAQWLCATGVRPRRRHGASFHLPARSFPSLLLPKPTVTPVYPAPKHTSPPFILPFFVPFPGYNLEPSSPKTVSNADVLN